MAILLAAAIRIKTLSFSYQQGEKNSQQIQSQGNPSCALRCVCCRAYIHCTMTSALGIAAHVVGVLYASALISKINIQGSKPDYI